MNAQQYISSIVLVATAMGMAAALEAAIPLFARPAGSPRRRTANLAMTMQTLAVAFVLNAAAGAVAAALPIASPGLMAAAGVPLTAQVAIGVVALDFAFGYAAHRSMHALPALWQFHRVHHSDPFVDVTTSFRTHPVETAWRHLWLFATFWLFGLPAVSLIVFRILSAVNGVFEHANIRVPPRLDAIVSRLWVTPNMHKVHHSRERAETDSNYGNIFALHDRLLGTFIPSRQAFVVEYGLDDVQPSEIRSVAALLAMPWRARRGARPALQGAQ